MDEEKKWNVLLADSQFLVTESLKMLIQQSSLYTFAGLADTVPNLAERLKMKDVDLLIADFELIAHRDFEEVKAVVEKFPLLPILVLTNNLTSRELTRLQSLNIKNILYKTADEEELFLAMGATLKNKKYYCDEVLDLLLEQKNSTKHLQLSDNMLTPTEKEIVKLVAGGLTTKEIAEKRNVSFHTVISHRKNIFAKLKINNASELSVYAVRAGLINDIEYYI